MIPDFVVGSAHSPPAVWKVSRQSPRFGRSTFCTSPHTSFQSGARVAQHQFSYARRNPCSASRSASSRRSDASVSIEPVILGESEEPTCPHQQVRTTSTTENFCTNLQHIAPHRLHNPHPPLRPSKRILPLPRPGRPPLEIRKRLHHHNLQPARRAHLPHLPGSLA